MNLIRDTAINIGNSLWEEAFWNEDRTECNWMARSFQAHSLSAPNLLCSQAVGPDLYSGSSGIALFLAELFKETRSERFREASVGAARRSISYLKQAQRKCHPLSFFLGKLGIAHSTWSVADNAGDHECKRLFFNLLDQIVEQKDEIHLLDTIGGIAGGIPALLAFGKHSNAATIEMALECGNRICNAANWSGKLCTWDSLAATGFHTSRQMAGMAHGASGMALSLLELYRQTSDTKFLDVARGAFNYEDTLFRDNVKNWVDTRFDSTSEASEAQEVFANAWCHGAPGIALVRVRAINLDPDLSDLHQDIATIALNTSIHALDAMVSVPGTDATLCHGILGISEVILTCGELVGNSVNTQLCLDVANSLISHYGRANEWPSGIPGGGQNPSLMLGKAGIGYHLLRLTEQSKVGPILLQIVGQSRG
jgi:lantibiotic modifying enzyme